MEKILTRVFEFWKSDESEPTRPDVHVKHRRDFVFHMTDWLDDLAELNQLYRRPEDFSKREAAMLVYRFLIHALPHLNAASRILLNKDDLAMDAFASMYRDAKPVKSTAR